MGDIPQGPSPRTSFVLASVAGAAMIVNRLDFAGGTEAGAGVGAGLLDRGHHEAGEIDLLSELAIDRARRTGPGVVVIDGGANIGTHTIVLAKRMFGWGTVVAYEPQLRIFYALAGNIALNNCFNARAILAALSAKSGSMRIPQLNHQLPANFGALSLKPGINQDPGQPVDFTDSAMATVQTVAIDDLKAPRLDIIKLDLEGMEPDALDGARETIDRLKPIIFAEITTCGNIAVGSRLPGYELIPAGMSVLAVHKDDPALKRIKVVGDNQGIEIVDPAP